MAAAVRIQSECALTYMNASSGQNLSAVRTAQVNAGAHAVESCGALDRCQGQVRSLRTNVTCVWGVSDPLQLGCGAKKGAWQAGSLTPHLPPTVVMTAPSGNTRGRERRSLAAAKWRTSTTCAAAGVSSQASAEQRPRVRTAFNKGERCSRVSVPPPCSPS
jgi:hypothetical protein